MQLHDDPASRFSSSPCTDDVPRHSARKINWEMVRERLRSEGAGQVLSRLIMHSPPSYVSCAQRQHRAGQVGSQQPGAPGQK